MPLRIRASRRVRSVLSLSVVVGLLATWLVAAPAAAAPSTAGQFVPVTSTRLLDTTLGPSTDTAVQTRNRGGVPSSGVSAVVINLTADRPTSSAGYLTAYPNLTARPVISAVNLRAGETRSDQVTVPVGSDGQVRVYNSAGRTRVLVDVVGYYLSGTTSATGADYRVLTPRRVLGVALRANETRTVPLNLGALNGSTRAVAVNITATGPVAAGSFTAWSGAGAAPATPLLTFRARQSVANNAVVATRTVSGVPSIAIRNNSTAGTQVLVDLVGHYTVGGSGDVLRYRSVAPFRLVDTRNGTGIAGGALNAGETRASRPITSAVLTTRTKALVTTLTAVGATTATYLTAWGPDGSRPGTSNVNAVAGETVPNGAVIAAARGRSIRLYNSAGRTHALVDVTGTFEAPAPVTLQSITVSPNPLPSLPVGTSAQLTATGRYSDGSTANLTSQVTWTPGNSRIRVSTAGRITAVAVGSTSVTASLNGTTSAALTTSVVPAVARELSVTPADVAAEVGQSGVRLTARLTLTDDSTEDVTTGATWSSSDTGLVTVDAQGRLTLRAIGTTTVTAAVGDLSDTARVVVSARSRQLTGLSVTPPDLVVPLGVADRQLDATARYDDSTTADVSSTVTWSSSDTTIAEIGSDKTITPVAVGTVTVRASLSGQTAAVTVRIVAAAVTRVVLTPASANLAVGNSRNFRAEATYTDGRTVDVTADADWVSSNPVVAEVTGGTVSARSTGTTDISATIGGRSDTADVVVGPAEVVRVAISTPSDPIPVGRTGESAATVVTYSDGRTVTGVTASWTSSDTDVLRVADDGRLTAVSPGTARVTGTVAGVSGSADVEVVEAALVSLVVSPSVVQVPLGITGRTVQATATFTAGDPQILSGVFTSSDTSVATVDDDGRITTVAQGTTTITATYRGRQETAEVRVTAPVITRLQIASPGSVPLGVTNRRLAAQVTYSDAQTAATGAVDWASSNPAVLTVATDGTITPVAVGSATVTATLRANPSITDTAVVSIVPAAVDQLTLSPATQQVPVGVTDRRITATATYTDRTSRNVTTDATWTSSDASVVAVDQNGNLTARQTGTVTITATLTGANAGTSATATVEAVPGVLIDLSLTPNNPTIPLGTSTTLTATASYSDDTAIGVGGGATCTSSNTAVATVTATGTVAAVGRGTATIQATYGDRTATTTITVSPATVTRIDLTITPTAIPLGATGTARATATYTDNSTADVTADTAWSSTDTSVATIDGSGAITTRSQGQTTLTARYAGRESTVSVMVAAPALVSLVVSPSVVQVPLGITGRTVQATATFTAGDPQILSGVFTSSDTSVATVDDDGRITTVAQGTTTITATYRGRQETAEVRVIAPVITAVRIASTGSVPLGVTSQRLTAQATYSNGQTAATSAVDWTSSDPGVLTVAADGTITTVAVGSSVVTARLQADASISDTLVVAVTPPAISRLTLTPNAQQVPVGVTDRSITATATYTDNSTAGVSTRATWTSSNSDVVEVDRNGGLTAKQAGSVTITAAIAGTNGTTNATITGTATVEAVPAVVIGLSIAPNNPVLPLGTSAALTATARYSDGTSVGVGSGATWTSSNDAVVITVTPAGTITAVGRGTATVTVTSDGRTATVTVTVTDGTATGLDVTVTPATIPLGATGAARAVATFTDGTTTDVTTGASWTSSDTGVATVDAAGIVSARALGQATLTGRYAGTTSTVSITVTAPALVSLTVSPSALEVPLGITGRSVRATATLTAGDPEVVTGVFTSSDPSVATVDDNGRITTVAEGTTTITASYRGRQASAQVRVVAPVITRLQIASPGSIPLGVGNRRVAAQVTYSDGQTGTTGAVDWTSSNPAVLTVATDSTITPVAVGSATVTAALRTDPSITDTTVVTIVPAVIDQLVISPTSQQVPVGVSGRRVTARAVYTDRTSRDATSDASWTSSEASVVEVDQNGNLTARQTGSVTITATLGGISGNAGVEAVPGVLVGLVVTPSDPTIPLGTSTTLTATASYSDGTAIGVGGGATWTSSNTDVVTITPTGTVTAVGRGTATVQAAFGDRTATVSVTVSAAVVAGLDVTITPASIPLGATGTARAIATYTDGTTSDVTGDVSWSSSDTGVATVDGRGAITTRAEGQAAVTGRFDGRQSSATVTVAAPALAGVRLDQAGVSVALGQSDQLTATARYTDGSDVDVTTSATWTTSNAAVAGVNGGRVTGTGLGSATVTATFGDQSASAAVAVTSAVLTGVTVTPTSLQMPLGSATRAQYSGQTTVPGPEVRARYSDGTTADVTSQSTWASSNPDAVRIEADNSLRAVGLGQAGVTATYGGRRASLTVTVTVPIVTRIEVTQPAAALPVGTTLQLVATAYDSNLGARLLSGTGVWSSDNPQVATVSATGEVRAIAVGRAVVTAQVDGVQASVTVEVVGAVVRVVTVTPAVAELIRGRSAQLTATALYTDGRTEDVSARATWTSNNPAAVTVSSTGLATAVAPGSAQVRAGVGAVVSTAAVVTVPPVVVTSVAVTGETTGLPQGRSRQLRATATYSDGTTADVTTQATWDSTPLGRATVSGTGVLTGLTTGTTAVTASFGGVTSPALPVAIATKVVDSISVTPASSTLSLLQKRTYVATAVYSDGTTENVSSRATWSVSADALATISTGGEVTAVAVGTVTVSSTFGGQTGTATLRVLA